MPLIVTNNAQDRGRIYDVVRLGHTVCKMSEPL